MDEESIAKSPVEENRAALEYEGPHAPPPQWKRCETASVAGLLALLSLLAPSLWFIPVALGLTEDNTYGLKLAARLLR